MVTLEQVKLLETKVVRAIDYVERISRENSQLQGKLDSYQKRIDELEVLIQQFREDQGRIEEGILAALERLNKFEDAIEKSIAGPAESRPPRRQEKPAAKPKAEIIPAGEPEEPAGDSGENIEAENSETGDTENHDITDQDIQNIEDNGGGEDFSVDNPAAGELDIF
jgi:chromosome segregation ATPase